MFGFLKRQPPENKLLLAELKRISENYTGPNIFDRIVAKAAAEEISSAMKKKIRASRKTPFPKAVGQPVMLHISSCPSLRQAQSSQGICTSTGGHE